ncbi:MAG: phosphoribosyl-AMP cyclohydrolase [bacterium]
MTKRRVKAKAKGRSPKAPAIHKFAGKRKLRPEPREEPLEPRRAAVHKFAGRKADGAPAASAPPDAKPMNARLAAMAAASAEVSDEPEVKSKTSPSAAKGGVDWKDLEDDAPAAKPLQKTLPVDDGEPVLVKPKAVQTAEVDPGVQVVAKGASKFSAADLEMLRASIKVKGSGAVIEGVNLDELKWDGEGLLPVVAQDRRTGAVLTLGHTNRETLEATLRSKQMTYWNRNTGKPVTQGQESGHPQRLVKLMVDCDKDSVLALVEQDGPACHRDTGTCWTDDRAVPPAGFLGELDRIVKERAKTPEKGSKTSALLAEPIEALRAFVEQANELTKIVQGKSKGSIETGAADLLYNLLVTLRTKGVGLGEVLTELQAQHMALELKKQKE